MQQYYRIALGMCLLIGYLQAQPVKRKVLYEDFGFEDLKSVSCNQNVNFTSPTAVEESSYADAVICFKNAWENATEECNEDFQTGQTMEAFANMYHNLTQTPCKLNVMVHTEFASFVNASKEFVQQWFSSQ